MQPAREIEENSDRPSWCFYQRPHETWKAMYRDCSKARESIEFEQYILENDTVGQYFMELFTEKAKQGLKVFLICDTFGSALLYRSPLVRKFRRAGGKVHFYNPLKGWTMLMPWRWFPRTHTKTLLVDSQIAYIGGVCVAERMRHWRDTHMRVTGPVTRQVREAFDHIESKIMRRQAYKIPCFPIDSGFGYFINHPRQKNCTVYDELIKAINSAEKYIYITSAFFVPNRRFIRLLRQAHARGVDIRVIVPQRSDVLLADWLCLSYVPRFFKAGLRMFHYQETILHSKTAVIDDEWATVGSTNFDVISFFHNREANIIISDKAAIGELKQQFFSDLQFSPELTSQKWSTIPLWKKIAGFAARSIRAFF